MTTDAPLDDLFGALADPTRRALFQRLLQHGPDTATRLSADPAVAATISRQAVVKHLQALVEAGLAAPQRAGREVRYEATPEPLAAVVTWLVATSPQWDRRVERLRNLALHPHG